jgi:hypothetical protein
MVKYSYWTHSLAALAAVSTLTLYVVQSAILATPPEGPNGRNVKHAVAMAPLDPTGPRNPFCSGPFC